jgi:hypothetical protein
MLDPTNSNSNSNNNKSKADGMVPGQIRSWIGEGRNPNKKVGWDSPIQTPDPTIFFFKLKNGQMESQIGSSVKVKVQKIGEGRNPDKKPAPSSIPNLRSHRKERKKRVGGMVGWDSPKECSLG